VDEIQKTGLFAIKSFDQIYEAVREAEKADGVRDLSENP